MAKRQRVESQPTAPQDPAASRLDPLCFALGLLAAAIVYVSYHPSDSVAVEKGDALWFCMLGLILGGTAWVTSLWKSDWRESSWSDRLLDVLPWALATWIFIAAFLSCPPGNFRSATNEAWLWITAAAIFTASRRLFQQASARKSISVLLVVSATGLGVHGLHQYFISLPQHRAEYQSDPAKVLLEAGLDAPEGSAERMVFENRLFDGGPSGTFALANSFAAFLIVGIVMGAGILRSEWHRFRWRDRLIWMLPILVCAGALLGTRSRSALLATLIGIALIFVVSSRSGKVESKKRSRVVLLGVGGVSIVGLCLGLFVALFGNREWFEEAPASLSVRFQYWRSTWQLALDRPLLGCGPGNFQSMYERYREANTTEQIAEPHNLFFETLASGGFIALLLLLILLATGLWFYQSSVAKADDDREAAEDDSEKWVWLGAMLSLLMVWLLGWATRRVPDLDASLFALPVAIGLAFALWNTFKTSRVGSSVETAMPLDRIVVVTLLSLGLHLMVAGGWTVPGVAILIWIGAGMLLRQRSVASKRPKQDGSESVGSRKRVAIAVACTSVLLVGLLKWTSIDPVDAQSRLMETITMAQASGQLGKARTKLKEAVDADPWSPDAVLWMADFYRWQLLLQGDQPSARESWQQALQEAKQRAGEDPAVYRMIGAQQLHVYQRYGLESDLLAASESFGDAVRWSPANQWMFAQLAVIERERGEEAAATALGDRATTLSTLGGNIERALVRQQLYVAARLGKMVERGPVRRPASELLPPAAD
ncbi:MAG: O-antigen ligase family protein [Rubripirellula sp.]